jgi:hypothetical protein
MASPSVVSIDSESTYVNVRNLTVSQCQDALHEAMTPKAGGTSSIDVGGERTLSAEIVIITGYGKLHEVSMTWLKRRNIDFDTAVPYRHGKRGREKQHYGRIIVKRSEMVEYGIRMENQLRNEEVLRSSLVRGVAVMCLVGLPLFGNPIFLFFLQ